MKKVGKVVLAVSLLMMVFGMWSIDNVSAKEVEVQTTGNALRNIFRGYEEYLWYGSVKSIINFNEGETYDGVIDFDEEFLSNFIDEKNDNIEKKYRNNLKTGIFINLEMDNDKEISHFAYKAFEEEMGKFSHDRFFHKDQWISDNIIIFESEKLNGNVKDYIYLYTRTGDEAIYEFRPGIEDDGKLTLSLWTFYPKGHDKLKEFEDEIAKIEEERKEVIEKTRHENMVEITKPLLDNPSDDLSLFENWIAFERFEEITLDESVLNIDKDVLVNDDSSLIRNKIISSIPIDGIVSEVHKLIDTLEYNKIVKGENNYFKLQTSDSNLEEKFFSENDLGTEYKESNQVTTFYHTNKTDDGVYEFYNMEYDKADFFYRNIFIFRDNKLFRFKISLKEDKLVLAGNVYIKHTNAPTPSNIFNPDDYVSIDYSEIMRDREGKPGYKDTFYAEVLQYHETEYSASALLMKNGDVHQIYKAEFNVLPENRLLEGDKVDVYGVLEKLVDYKTVRGDASTVPLIQVTKVLIEGLDY